ncbi:MAG: hypothetical protein DBX67_07555 [Desulfovibrionaceae bacterium]|nr:MAG: hypothetical protein DBX67_07555 [Desulfovibrionaceae bacterium]
MRENAADRCGKKLPPQKSAAQILVRMSRPGQKNASYPQMLDSPRRELYITAEQWKIFFRPGRTIFFTSIFDRSDGRMGWPDDGPPFLL